MQLANTKQVRAVLKAEFDVKHMGENSWTNKCADETLRIVGVRVGYESSAEAQEAMRERAENALRAAGYNNEVKVTHTEGDVIARNYGGTYMRVCALKA